MKTTLSHSSIEAISEWMSEEGFLERPSNEKAKHQQCSAMGAILGEFTDELKDGYRELTQYNKSFRLPTAIIKKLKNPKKAVKLWTDHLVLQDVLEISSDMMSEMYHIAEGLASSGEYQKAVNVCLYLIYLNPYVAWFWQKLGQCWQALLSYEYAVYAYSVAINCEPLAWDLYRDCVKCLIEIHEYDRALSLLTFSIARVNLDTNTSDQSVLIAQLKALMQHVTTLQKKAA